MFRRLPARTKNAGRANCAARVSSRDEALVTYSPVSVGEHAVVAAGAVVIHDVEPYTLVAGVPAVVKRALRNDR
jgi:acetyltransferase-like isoleucine patch superfamily enzyme